MEYHQGFLNGAHLLQNYPKNSQGLVGGPPINGTLSHSCGRVDLVEWIGKLLLKKRGHFHDD